MRALCLILILAAVIGYNSMQKTNEETQNTQEIQLMEKRIEIMEKQQEEMLVALEEAAKASEDEKKAIDAQKEAASDAAKNAAEADEQEENENIYKNGTYTGEAQGFGGTIQIQLVLEDDTMTDISITSASGEDSAYLSQAQAVISAILSAQSTDVDTISGATFSSTGIINAVVDALGKAENG